MKLPFSLNTDRPWVIQRRDSIIVRGEGRRPVRWVVARSLCQFLSVDLSQVPPRDRPDALALKLEQWSPVSPFDAWVAWVDGRALAWVWPRETVAQAQEEAGFEIHEVVPESALREPSTVAGARLVTLAEGCEGQVWGEAGELTQTRWWPAQPDRAAWGRFLRGAGLESAAAAVTALEAPWRARPWASTRQRSGRARARLESRITLGAAVLLAVGATWFAGEVAGKYRRLGALEARLAEIQDASAEILTARADAYDRLGEIRRLSALLPPVPQGQLMADFSEAMGQALGTEGRFLRWQYQDLELQLTVLAGDAEPTALVRAFEQLPYVATVQVSRGRDARELQLRVLLEAA